MTFTDYIDLLESDRSIRRFDSNRKVDKDTLLALVKLTRYCASGRNLQPLRYRLVTSNAEKDALFSTLKWAGYYTDWDGPAPSERPAAYLVQCLDTDLTTNPMCDEGLQLQAITLGARTLGLGCCIIKAFDAGKAAELLSLPANMKPSYVLAIGYPAEKARIVDLPSSGDYKYYRDHNDTQCVPKRPLSDLII